MYPIHPIKRRLVAFSLLLSLFLQSCGNESIQLITPRPDKPVTTVSSPSKTKIESNEEPIDSLLSVVPQSIIPSSWLIDNEFENSKDQLISEVSIDSITLQSNKTTDSVLNQPIAKNEGHTINSFVKQQPVSVDKLLPSNQSAIIKKNPILIDKRLKTSQELGKASRKVEEQEGATYGKEPLASAEINLTTSEETVSVHSIDMLADKVFTAKGGHQVSLDFIEGELTAIVNEQLVIGFTRASLSLPVYIEPGFKVVDLDKYPSAWQQAHIEVVFPERADDGKGYVYIGRRGGLGGGNSGSADRGGNDRSSSSKSNDRCTFRPDEKRPDPDNPGKYVCPGNGKHPRQAPTSSSSSTDSNCSTSSSGHGSASSASNYNQYYDSREEVMRFQHKLEQEAWERGRDAWLRAYHEDLERQQQEKQRLRAEIDSWNRKVDERIKAIEEEFFKEHEDKYKNGVVTIDNVAKAAHFLKRIKESIIEINKEEANKRSLETYYIFYEMKYMTNIPRGEINNKLENLCDAVKAKKKWLIFVDKIKKINEEAQQKLNALPVVEDYQTKGWDLSVPIEEYISKHEVDLSKAIEEAKRLKSYIDETICDINRNYGVYDDTILSFHVVKELPITVFTEPTERKKIEKKKEKEKARTYKSSEEELVLELEPLNDTYKRYRETGPIDRKKEKKEARTYKPSEKEKKELKELVGPLRKMSLLVNLRIGNYKKVKRDYNIRKVIQYATQQGLQYIQNKRAELDKMFTYPVDRYEVEVRHKGKSEPVAPRDFVEVFLANQIEVVIIGVRVGMPKSEMKCIPVDLPSIRTLKLAEMDQMNYAFFIGEINKEVDQAGEKYNRLIKKGALSEEIIEEAEDFDRKLHDIIQRVRVYPTGQKDRIEKVNYLAKLNEEVLKRIKLEKHKIFINNVKDEVGREVAKMKEVVKVGKNLKSIIYEANRFKYGIELLKGRLKNHRFKQGEVLGIIQGGIKEIDRIVGEQKEKVVAGITGQEKEEIIASIRRMEEAIIELEKAKSQLKQTKEKVEKVTRKIKIYQERKRRIKREIQEAQKGKEGAENGLAYFRSRSTKNSNEDAHTINDILGRLDKANEEIKDGQKELAATKFVLKERKKRLSIANKKLLKVQEEIRKKEEEAKKKIEEVCEELEKAKQKAEEDRKKAKEEAQKKAEENIKKAEETGKKAPGIKRILEELRIRREWNNLLNEIRKKFKQLKINSLEEGLSAQEQFKSWGTKIRSYEKYSFLSEREKGSLIDRPSPKEVLEAFEERYKEVVEISEAYLDKENYDALIEEAKKTLGPLGAEFNRLQDERADDNVIVAKAKEIKSKLEAVIRRVEEFPTKINKSGTLASLQEEKSQIEEIIWGYSEGRGLIAKYESALEQAVQHIKKQLDEEKAEKAKKTGKPIEKYSLTIAPKPGLNPQKLRELFSDESNKFDLEKLLDTVDVKIENLPKEETASNNEKIKKGESGKEARQEEAARKEVQEKALQEAEAVRKGQKTAIESHILVCQGDAEFTKQREELLATDGKLKQNSDNKELQALHAEQLDKFHSHPLYQQSIVLGLQVAALRREAQKKAASTRLYVLGSAEMGQYAKQEYEAANRYEQEAKEIREILIGLRKITNSSNTPPDIESFTAGMEGMGESLLDTGKTVLNLAKFVINLQLYPVKQYLKLIGKGLQGNLDLKKEFEEFNKGLEKDTINVAESLKNFISKAQHMWESREEYLARLQALEELADQLDLYRRAFDAENYHLEEDKRGGYWTAEILQWACGEKMVEALAKCTIKGVQWASKAGKVAKGVEEISEATKAAINLEKGMHELREGVKLVESAKESEKALGAMGILGCKERQAKTAYEIAKEGGKHAGMYLQNLHLPDKQLRKAIRSFNKKIEIHKNLIEDPEKYLKLYNKDLNKWHNMNFEGQMNQIHNWQQEINNFIELKDIIEGILKNRQ